VQSLDQRQPHLDLRGSFGQEGAESKLRKFCICAATYPGGRGLESAKVSVRIQSVLNVSNFWEVPYF
jgi:hypothetical protein